MAASEVFRSFYSKEEALPLLELLNREGVHCTIEKTRVGLDKVIIGDENAPDFHLKILPEDFEKANRIIDAAIEQRITEVEPDYYLYSFTDDELLEIIRKPDEWNNQDVILSRLLLAERGIPITKEAVKQIRSERIRELGQPEKQQTASVWSGYFLAVFFSVIGIFYSLYMMTAKKILPDGRKAFVYDKSSRDHFRIMLAISLAMALTLVGVLRSRIFE